MLWIYRPLQTQNGICNHRAKKAWRFRLERIKVCSYIDRCSIEWMIDIPGHCIVTIKSPVWPLIGGTHLPHRNAHSNSPGQCNRDIVQGCDKHGNIEIPKALLHLYGYRIFCAQWNLHTTWKVTWRLFGHEMLYRICQIFPPTHPSIMRNIEQEEKVISAHAKTHGGGGIALPDTQ